MPHRTTESLRWRREGIGFVIRSQVTNLWRDLRFTLHHLTQSVAGSVGMSSRRALTRRLVPVPTIDRRGHQVPARYAPHRAGIDRWQCSGVGHIDSPSPGQPLSPPGAPALEDLRPKGTPVAEDEIEIEVVIEIPRGSRHRYEFDHERQIIRLDRRLLSATSYPPDDGFVPDTLAQDGDPLDALVLVEDPTFPGCHVMARPVAVSWMADEMGPDAEVICVPPHEPRWHAVADLDQLPDGLSDEIRHFFDIYNDLEPGKETSVKGYEGRKAALAEIEASRERFRLNGSSSHIEVEP